MQFSSVLCVGLICSLSCSVLTGAISPLSAAAAAAAAAGRVALSGSGVSGVLLASNLNEEVRLTRLKYNLPVTRHFRTLRRISDFNQ